MKVSELSGALLDYWVAVAQGNQEMRLRADACEIRIHPDFEFMPYSPSTAWAHGGPIIEREGMTVGTAVSDECAWRASYRLGESKCYGPTPLIAAMRAKVASHYGDEVPDVS